MDLLRVMLRDLPGVTAFLPRVMAQVLAHWRVRAAQETLAGKGGAIPMGNGDCIPAAAIPNIAAAAAEVGIPPWGGGSPSPAPTDAVDVLGDPNAVLGVGCACDCFSWASIRGIRIRVANFRRASHCRTVTVLTWRITWARSWCVTIATRGSTCGCTGCRVGQVQEGGSTLLLSHELSCSCSRGWVQHKVSEIHLVHVGS